MKPYTDYIRRWIQVVLAAALMVCAGCSDDFAYMDENGNSYETSPSDCLAFTTHLAPESKAAGSRSTVANLEIVEEQWPLNLTSKDSVSSRGTLAYSLSGEAGVIGFQYGVDTEKTPIKEDNNLKFNFEGKRLVSADVTIPWTDISKEYLNVYAYAPYLTTSTEMTIDYTTAPPAIDYKVPVATADQKDLLVARWISEEHTNSDGKLEDYKNKTIPLVFDHALTAIRFRVGFKCTVKSVVIKNVHNHGIYNFSDNKTWTIVGESSGLTTETYTLDFGTEGHTFKQNQFLAKDPNNIEYMILMPQTLPENAEIVLTCADNTYTAKIGGKLWTPGKLITYTFYKDRAPGTVYFDLALADVVINETSYSGKIHRDGATVDVTGTHKSGNRYYVYQSTPDNENSIWSGDVFTSPVYGEIMVGSRPWREYITNNPDVDAVIDAWSNINTDEGSPGNDNLAKAAGRCGTPYHIDITGNVTCELTIDNIYSTYQEANTSRKAAGITFVPIRYDRSVENARVTINMVGDNRVGGVHYANEADNGNEIIFEGTGSLTVADVDGNMEAGSNNFDAAVGLNGGESGYYSNHWNSAIGSADNGEEKAYGIVINSGIIFAGTTKAENCSAIGGGGNGYGLVTINGGTVTAVATTTGTAIGGGIGFNNAGGEATVSITGGNVYAYNHANRWRIPSSAIGGAGSKSNRGSQGTVNISGGYVYAESELGTAIGGGSSYTKEGGAAVVNITGGEVIAKTLAPGSASIGGGTAYSIGFESATGQPPASGFNGGNADITINGNPIIRTGSIGGGGTGAGNGKKGYADIVVNGGDIQAQFILEAGTTKVSSFTLRSGTIRNSDTSRKEYIEKDGGAVWLQNGTVLIEGGTIKNCKATRGGAIYIDGSGSSATFTMSGGTIEANEAGRKNNTGTGDNDDFAGSGGAVYIINGNVTLTGGTIAGNLASGGYGGGVFIGSGNLTVGGATIKNNASIVRRNEKDESVGGYGGGVYVYSKESERSDVTVNLESGTISGNTADRRGGGLCVIQESAVRHANITIGTEKGTADGLQIIRNHSLQQGGGLYAKGVNANIVINSGTIMNNTVSQYVHNQDVANDKGSVTLNDGNVEVDYITVTFNANDDSDNPETSTQKIVTETNSLLKAPAFERLGYKIVGWNTKPSGSGTDYTDGQVMNTDKNVTLYAQWALW